MKESQSQPRKSPTPNGVCPQSTHSTPKNVDKRNVLKRCRERTSPLLTPNTNCARVTAYKTNGPEDSPRSTKSNGKHFQKELIFTSTRYDNCSSPPAKIPVCNNLVYAGAKFHDPPAPEHLPKPPTHWFTPMKEAIKRDQSCAEMTGVLKVMLRVPTVTPQIKVQS